MKKFLILFAALFALYGCAHLVNMNDITGLMVGPGKLGLIVSKNDKPDRLGVYDAIIIGGRMLLKYNGYLDTHNVMHPVKGNAAVYEQHSKGDTVEYIYAGYITPAGTFVPVEK